MDQFQWYNGEYSLILIWFWNNEQLFIYTNHKSRVKIDLIWFIVFNATFSNISAISWRPVLVVEEAGVPGGATTTMGKQLVSFITCGCESSAPFFYLQRRARTHAILVIGLYELLGNPTI